MVSFTHTDFIRLFKWFWICGFEAKSKILWLVFHVSIKRQWQWPWILEWEYYYMLIIQFDDLYLQLNLLCNLTAIQWLSMRFQWHSDKWWKKNSWKSLRFWNVFIPIYEFEGNFLSKFGFLLLFNRSETIWRRWVGNQKYFYVLICQISKEHQCKWFLVFDFETHWWKL